MPKRLDLYCLAAGYELCARSEGKSESSVKIVINSISYLDCFLASVGASGDVSLIGPNELRGFILYLQNRQSFSGHPFSHPQDRKLSDQTVNCYMRSLRIFWSWLVREGILAETPFAYVKLPRIRHKVIPTFSESDIWALLSAINTASPQGYRDYAIILTLLDTGMRLSELTGLKFDDAHLDDGVLKVLGETNRERVVPIGRDLKRCLWRYVNLHRPDPASPQENYLVLSHDGRRLKKNRIECLVKKYSQRAGITGVRCSPHTLRHTAAVSFLRNDGDVFSLQRIMGHADVESLSIYVNITKSDVAKAHRSSSPADNLNIRSPASMHSRSPSSDAKKRRMK